MKQTIPSSAEDLELVRNLTQRRKELRITQHELAERMSRIGVALPQSSISKVEKGSRNLSAGEASAYAQALGISLTDLLPPSPESNLLFKAKVAQRKTQSALRKLLSSANELLTALEDETQAINALREITPDTVSSQRSIEEPLAQYEHRTSTASSLDLESKTKTLASALEKSLLTADSNLVTAT